MKNLSVDQLDKMRYNTIKYTTISFVLFYCPLIVSCFTLSPLARIINTIALLIGTAVLFLFTLKSIRINRKIQSDMNLKQALIDEMFTHNTYKSFQNGFITMILSLMVLMVLTSFNLNIPGAAVCYIEFFVGIITVAVSFLIYNKESR